MARVVDGRFELLDRLGGGGMGWVWRARDLLLDREVALKEVRPRDPRFAEQDARAVSTIRSRVLRAVAGDDTDLAGRANDKPGSFRLADFVLGDEAYGIGLPKLSPIRQDVAAALQKMSRDGTLDRSLSRNLPLLADRGAPGTGSTP